MRAICWLACPGVLALALARPAPADDSAELKPLVDRVLKAYGGEAKLSGLQAYVEKTKITVPDGPTATLARYVQLPDQTRLESESELGGKRVKCEIVYAGDSGWKHTEGQPTVPHRSPFTGRKEPLKYAGPRAWLRLKDPAYTLAPLGASKVGDRSAFGIGVKSPDAPEERCFFDQESGLLLKVEQTTGYPQGKQSVVEETYYAGYKTTDGIPVAREITRKRDGKTTQQIEVVDFKVAEKLDAQLFQKP
jgi:hypothetical protein